MAPSKLAKQTRKVALQDAAAAHRLAGWYLDGEEGLDSDHTLWFRWEEEAAERKCADAQYTLGNTYAQGTMGLQVAPAIAFGWLQKAALQSRAFDSDLDTPVPFFSA